MRKNVHGGTTWFSFDNLSREPGLRHFVSTRRGGVSEPPFDTLNLGLHVEDRREDIIENRRRLLTALNIAPDCLTAARQVHGGTVTVVDGALRGSGSSDYSQAIPATDAMITGKSGICLAVVVADCVPVLVYDPRLNVAGAAHAGWRGTAAGVVTALIKAMRDTFSSSPGCLVAGIGPAVRPCCYDVGEEVVRGLEGVLGSGDGVVHRERGRTTVDLQEANRLLLLAAGLREDNIETMDICTCCRADLFFSVRHQKGSTGRFAAGIMLK